MLKKLPAILSLVYSVMLVRKEEQLETRRTTMELASGQLRQGKGQNRQPRQEEEKTEQQRLI